MPVETGGLLLTARGCRVFCGRQQGFDDVQMERRQCGDDLERAGRSLVPACAIDALHELLTTQLLEIVGGAAWGVGGGRWASEPLDLTREVRRRKAAGCDREGEYRLGRPAHARFVEVNATDFRPSDLRGKRQRVERLAADEAALDARQGLDEALEHRFEISYDSRKLCQRASLAHGQPSGHYLPQRLYLLLDGRGLDGRGMPVEVIDLPCIIGSEKKSNVWINSPQIETHHLKITHEKEGWIIEDLNSEHGTFLGDKKIKRRVIQNGDEYRLAGYLRLRTELR